MHSEYNVSNVTMGVMFQRRQQQQQQIWIPRDIKGNKTSRGDKQTEYRKEDSFVT